MYIKLVPETFGSVHIYTKNYQKSALVSFFGADFLRIYNWL